MSLLRLIAVAITVLALSASSTVDASVATLTARAPAGFTIGGVLHGYDPAWDTGSYAETAAAEFNAVTTSIYLPWGPIDRDLAPGTPVDQISIDTAPFDKVVDWAAERDLLVHGHALVYPGANQHADWYLDPAFDGKRAALIERMITTVAGANPDGVHVWDVVNEVIGDPHELRSGVGVDEWGLRTRYVEYHDIGSDYVDQAFRWADAAVGDHVALIINDYGAETLNPKSDALLAYAIELRRRGVPIDGVGFQMHLDAIDRQPDFASIEANLRRFADAGFDLYITELDVKIVASPQATRPSAAQLQRQAETYSAITDLAIRVPRLDTLLFWDYADGRSWLHPTDRELGGLPIGTYTHPTPWAGGDGGEPLEPKPAYWAIAAAVDAATQRTVRVSNAWEPASGFLARLGNRIGPAEFEPTSSARLYALTPEAEDWTSMWWTFEPTGDGYFAIRAEWHGESGYLGRTGHWDGDEWVPGDDVFVSGYEPGKLHQQWAVRPNGNGTVSIVNRWHPETGVLSRDGQPLGDDRYAPLDTVALRSPRRWSSQHWRLED